MRTPLSRTALFLLLPVLLAGSAWAATDRPAEPLSAGSELTLERREIRMEVFRISSFTLDGRDRDRFKRDPAGVIQQLLEAKGHFVRKPVIRERDLEALLTLGPRADKCMYHVVSPESERSMWITTDCP